MPFTAVASVKNCSAGFASAALGFSGYLFGLLGFQTAHSAAVVSQVSAWLGAYYLRKYAQSHFEIGCCSHVCRL
jgi:hypothetical protein